MPVWGAPPAGDSAHLLHLPQEAARALLQDHPPQGSAPAGKWYGTVPASVKDPDLHHSPGSGYVDWI